MIFWHRNPYWLSFIGCVLLCAMLYSGYTLFYLYQYLRLDLSLSPKKIEWSIAQEKADAFVPVANYTFDFRGKTYTGETHWQEAFLNQWAADEAISRLKNQSIQVWFDSSSPSYSTLQKVFPLKISLYTLMLWGLIAYLVWLDHSMIRYRA